VRLRNTGSARWLAARRGLGGTVLRVELVGAAEDTQRLPWIEMPRDLAPGDEHTFEASLRRPLGEATLAVNPCLLELGDAWQFGGPSFRERV
jgi:hypothetical protein